MNVRRIGLVGIGAAALVAVAGAYLLLDDRGVAEARAWADHHPAFDEVPQAHWQMTADRTSSLGPLDGRLLPRMNATVAQRRTVWDVPGDDFDTVVDHVGSLVRHDGTRTEAFGHRWHEQPGSTSHVFATESERTDEWARGVSVSVTDTGAGVEVIITANQTDGYARR